MIKKKIIIILLCSIVVSCGKKGDPVYKDPEKKAQKQIILMKIA